jgi:hypothetical protein
MSASPTRPDTSLQKIDLSDDSHVERTQNENISIVDVEKALTQTISTKPSLPPVDRGAQAWLFLAGCYVMEMLVFGMYLNLI